MYVCYYFFNLLRDYERGNDSFLRHQLLVNMHITKEHKILIKTLLALEGYNANQ